ncbi:MAG TPA: rubredoxin, partial [Maribacter sp.]|nr:rubredoxin [Maribacter sp.]
FEEIYEDITDIDELFFVMNKNLETNNRTMEKELKVPFQTFPYYEGMNRLGPDMYWLGLYWRNNKYDLSFLKAFCGFCLDNSIGKICITPWKSFVVKGIKKSSRPALERFLGKRGINVRHSQLEMNWHVPIDDGEALELKKFLVRSFDQNDISTYGLTFCISNEVGKRSHFASVIIEKNSLPTIVKDFEVRPTYNVLHFEHFDPNSQKYITYAQDIDKIELPGLLMELSKMYFDQLGRLDDSKETTNVEVVEATQTLFQCQDCLTVYDESFGDVALSIAAGTKFQDIDEHYECPVCSAPKAKFKETMIQMS